MKRTVTKAAVLCITVLVILAAAGCGTSTKEPDNVSTSGSSVIKGSGFTVTLTANPRVVMPGGTVPLTLSVRNVSGKDRTFELGTPQTSEFIAFDESGTEIWKWSNGKFFAQVITQVTIAAGEVKVYKESWEVGSLNPMTTTVEGYFLGLKDLKPRVKVEISAEQSSSNSSPAESTVPSY